MVFYVNNTSLCQVSGGSATTQLASSYLFYSSRPTFSTPQSTS